MPSDVGTLRISGADDELDANDQEHIPGHGRAWGKYVIRNPEATEKHPYVCALCNAYKYIATSCNATKVGWHICGKKGKVTRCAVANASHFADFPQFKPSELASDDTAPPTSGARASQPRPLELQTNTTSESAGSLLNSHSGELTMSQIVALQLEEEQRQLALNSNMNSLPGLLKHVVNKQEAARLNTLWAKALHHAGIPPNAMEDDYVRDAIFQTSQCKVKLLWLLSVVAVSMPSYVYVLQLALEVADMWSPAASALARVVVVVVVVVVLTTAVILGRLCATKEETNLREVVE